MKKRITRTTKKTNKKHYKINYYNVFRLVFWVSIFTLLICNLINQSTLIMKYNRIEDEFNAIKNAVDFNDTINLR